MPKLRHIAYRAADVEGMAQFFAQSFDMAIAQRRTNGAIDLSDGVINVTILPLVSARQDGQPQHQGIDHIGFTVEDENESRKKLIAAGGTELNTINLGGVANYEVKFLGPENIIVDFGHWIGAAPIDEQSAVSGQLAAVSN